MIFNIETPDSLDVQSRGLTVTVDITKLPEDIIAHAVLHGLKQRIADSAAGAAYSACLAAIGTEKAKHKANVSEWTGDESNRMAIAKEGERMMLATVATLEGGDWGVVRTGGGGVDPVRAKARQLAAVDLKLALTARDGNAKAYTGLATAAKHETLDAFIDKASKDYLADARKAIEDAKQAAKSVDLGELGL